MGSKNADNGPSFDFPKQVWWLLGAAVATYVAVDIGTAIENSRDHDTTDNNIATITFAEKPATHTSVGEATGPTAADYIVGLGLTGLGAAGVGATVVGYRMSREYQQLRRAKAHEICHDISWEETVIFNAIKDQELGDIEFSRLKRM